MKGVLGTYKPTVGEIDVPCGQVFDSKCIAHEDANGASMLSDIISDLKLQIKELSTEVTKLKNSYGE